ncbi:MAG: 4Fe-4S binding protein [Candidatus Cloacimonetes bacterium]|nr:4Fe-4S binding protein [Candidatus Cloacimonadota bacterium]MCF7813000.1 4Fe-4S binding protein [Candidatus Cloacimonadota bacterium]MCF7867268.1 4Fe-4S binding protein [Candidatus Cloacimonadota bacterium]MCF7882712.1 4Fe-4S binding protein [Candidatus Cloacimonadota bacterium]
MKRQIIEIDEKKCNGCGLCIPGCPEGALQIIDGKVRLVSDLFCDGLGACLGECPEGAINTIEREAEAYDEARVMEENIIPKGKNTIKAHLKHLKDHGETEYFEQAVAILMKKGLPIPKVDEDACPSGGCPGTAAQAIQREEKPQENHNVQLKSELRQWPVQLHLVNPNAPYLKNADLLIAADCVPFAYPNFHQRFMKGKIVINLCPKLDKDIDKYIDKLAEIFINQDIKSLTIVRMEVPCCGGTEWIVQKAMEKAGKIIMPRVNVVSIQGEII